MAREKLSWTLVELVVRHNVRQQAYVTVQEFAA